MALSGIWIETGVRSLTFWKKLMYDDVENSITQSVNEEDKCHFRGLRAFLGHGD